MMDIYRERDIYRGIYGDVWKYMRDWIKNDQRTLKDSELLGSESQEDGVMSEGVWTAEVRRDGWICLG